MDIVNEFLNETRKELVISGMERDWLEVRPAIYCVDGFRVSVQASSTHYATPRSSYGPYSHVECGYPSERPPQSWREYAEGEWEKPGFFGRIGRIIRDDWRMLWWAIKNKYWWSVKRRLSGMVVDNATDTVYAYIPVELVEDAINEHGGIDWNRIKEEESRRTSHAVDQPTAEENGALKVDMVSKNDVAELSPDGN